MFAHYAFIAAQPWWTPAKYTAGVIRLVPGGADGRPSQISDGVIDGLRARERGGLVQLPAAPAPPKLRPGCRVRVTTGLFSRRTGVVALHKGMNGSEKLVILMGMLRVELARSAVEIV